MGQRPHLTHRTQIKMAARHCCVPTCTSNERKRLYHKNYKVSFHTFPKEEKRRKAWITAICREEGNNFKVHERNTVVCSKHFVDADIHRSFNRRKQLLKPGAIPKVFPWSEPEEMPAPRSLRPRKVLKVPDPQSSSDPECTTSDAPADPEAEDAKLRVVKQRPVKKLDVKLWQQDHDYFVRNYAHFTPAERLEAATHYIQELEAKVLDLRSQRFCLDRFSLDPKLVSFYTGFPNHEVLQAAFLAFKPTAERMTQCSWKQCQRLGTGPLDHQAFCQENLALVDQFFLFLVKLKLGSLDQDLAFRFGVSISCVKQIILIWANYLYALLGAMPIWPSRSQVSENMPACFSRLYSHTRVILDCAELKIECDPDQDVSSETQDPNQGKITSCKGLVGITPAGGVSFISTLYASPISNRNLALKSLISELLDPGDQVMVGQKIPIQDELKAVGASLVAVPTALKNPKSTYSYREFARISLTEYLHKHIQRALERVKKYHIFDRPIPASIANQLWTVCCLLTNFKGPLVGQNA